MTIDNEKLIERLIERTGMEKAEVEEQLSHLVEEILEKVGEGEPFEVEGFGTFSVDDNTLNFMPAEELRTEINYRYAGMKPIEIMKGYGTGTKEAAAEEMRQEEKAGAAASKGEKDEEKKKQKEERREEQAPEIKKGTTAAEQDKPKEKKAEPKEESKSEEEDTPRPKKEEVPSPEVPTKQKEKKPAASAEKTESEKKEKKKKVAEKKSGKKKPEKKKVEKPTVQELRRKNDYTTPIMIGVVIVVVAGFITWGLMQSQTGSQDTQTASTGQVEQQDTQQPAAGQSASRESSDQQQTTGKQPTADKSGPPAFGLRGTVSKAGMSGYTIVVYSFSKQRNASDMQRKLEQQNYRVVVSNVTLDDGSETYRVGLGQFKTVDAALRAAKKLKKPYRNNHFIKRIQ